MPDWNARQIQLVWFPSAGSSSEARELFTLIASTKPSSTQTGELPSPMGNVKFENAQGLDEEGNGIAIQITPGRIDIVLSPASQENEPSARPALFHNSGTAIARAETFVAPVSEKIGSCSRLAVLLALNVPAKTLAEANTAALNEIGIPSSRLEGGSDVMFSINVRKSFTWGQANRLLRWGVEAFQSVVVQFGTPSATPINIEPLYATSLSIDINTVAGPLEFDGDKKIAAFRDLIAEAKRLWDAGTLDSLRVSE